MSSNPRHSRPCSQAPECQAGSFLGLLFLRFGCRFMRISLRFCALMRLISRLVVLFFSEKVSRKRLKVLTRCEKKPRKSEKGRFLSRKTSKIAHNVVNIFQVLSFFRPCSHFSTPSSPFFLPQKWKDWGAFWALAKKNEIFLLLVRRNLRKDYYFCRTHKERKGLRRPKCRINKL